MKSLRNKVSLIGNLGMDVELKTLTSGTHLAKFSLATNDSYKDANGERVEDTQWHNVIAWGKTAELAEKLLVKGSEVALEGKLVNRSYEDKDGNKKYISEIVLNEFLLLGKRESAGKPF